MFSEPPSNCPRRASRGRIIVAVVLALDLLVLGLLRNILVHLRDSEIGVRAWRPRVSVVRRIVREVCLKVVVHCSCLEELSSLAHDLAGLHEVEITVLVLELCHGLRRSFYQIASTTAGRTP